MKKHLILISLLFTTAFPALFGQTLQVGMRWEYLGFPFIIINPNQTVAELWVEIAGDTLIQGKEYFQLATNTYPCNLSLGLLRRWNAGLYYYRA